MKKLLTIMLCLALSFSLCACGRRNKTPETTPTAPATTIPMTTAPIITTTVPMPDPTIDTNVPDPSVDTSIPEMTDLLPTDETATDMTTETSEIR